MKTLLKLVGAVMAVFLFIGCTTSKSTVSNHVDLSRYKYASVINNDTYHIPAELMEYEIQLYDAVEASGLQLVSEMRIFELSPEEQSKLLLVKYGVTQSENESIVTVNFIDYLTGRPVVSCRGAYGLSLSYGKDLQIAIKKVEKQIASTFRK